MDPNLTKTASPPPVGNQPQNPPTGNYSDSPSFPWSSANAASKVQTAEPKPPVSPVNVVTSPEIVNTAPPQPVTFAPPVSPPVITQTVAFAPPVEVPVNTQTPASFANIPPTVPPLEPPAENHPLNFKQGGNKKFPLLMITGVLLVIITGFSGSYIYFRTQSKAHGTKNITPKITPPVKEITPVVTINPAETVNPFDNKETYENPFSNEPVYENPFGEDETDIADTSYQNPFEVTK